uniref:MADF domain-containing protein n=1 Tax=Sinocyclocheilus rhinocerous TaxID=307959 RepID=A0A673G2E1_9TELE
MDVEVLLALVSEHRELFDKTVDEVKAKWENLRDTYTRRKTEEVDECRSGQASWSFFVFFCSVHSSIEECDGELEDGDGSGSEQATCSSGASTTSSEPVHHLKKKRKQTETPDFMERYLAAKEARERESEKNAGSFTGKTMSVYSCKAWLLLSEDYPLPNSLL